MRRHLSPLLLLGGLLLAPLCARPAAAQLELELLEALPVEGLESSQPSGLCLVDGQLYAVSDKHDHAICRVQFDGDVARLEPYITFNAPWSGAWVRGLDFEGIDYRAGSFFLVSESTFRVLRVHETGSDLAWVTPSVEEAGKAAGLFTEKNARLEGLALLGGGRLLLAAERAPRGLIDLTVDAAGETVIRPLVCEETILNVPPPRVPDFSDLWLDDGGLYALSRNADAVLRIDVDEAGLQELDVWSFAATLNDPAWAYRDMEFGKAEGLAMDDERVYVIVDNNGLQRQADPTDTRPLLFVFARPR